MLQLSPTPASPQPHPSLRDPTDAFGGGLDANPHPLQQRSSSGRCPVGRATIHLTWDPTHHHHTTPPAIRTPPLQQSVTATTPSTLPCRSLLLQQIITTKAPSTLPDTSSTSCTTNPPLQSPYDVPRTDSSRHNKTLVNGDGWTPRCVYGAYSRITRCELEQTADLTSTSPKENAI